MKCHAFLVRVGLVDKKALALEQLLHIAVETIVDLGKPIFFLYHVFLRLYLSLTCSFVLSTESREITEV